MTAPLDQHAEDDAARSARWAAFVAALLVERGIVGDDAVESVRSTLAYQTARGQFLTGASDLAVRRLLRAAILESGLS